MIRHLRADVPGPSFNGGAQSKATVQSAGEPYLLKLTTPDKPKVTFNELLGVVVAGLAGLMTAPYALVTVAADLLPNEGGEDFGSVILTGNAPLDPSYVCGLSDGERDELYYLLAFDLLILNHDRKFGELLRSGNAPLIPVDHGNALSGNWTIEHLKTCHDGGIDVRDRRIVYCTLTDEQHARRAAQRLAANLRCNLLPALGELCSVIPIGDVECEAVRGVLEYRLKNLERLAVRQGQDYARVIAAAGSMCPLGGTDPKN